MEDESEEEEVDDWERTSQSSLKDVREKNFGRGKKQNRRLLEFTVPYFDNDFKH